MAMPQPIHLALPATVRSLQPEPVHRLSPHIDSLQACGHDLTESKGGSILIFSLVDGRIF